MSTNYYLKRIPTEKEISQCHHLLDERKIEYCDRYGEGYDAPYLEQVLEKMTETLHIGSHSGGWRFLFRIHDDLYERSIQSCLDYLQAQLNTGLWRIIDEYGSSVALDDFEKVVINSLSGITIENYHKTHPEDKQWYRYGPPQIIANDGSRWWDADFS